jgi:hypothetical protein
MPLWVYAPAVAREGPIRPIALRRERQARQRQPPSATVEYWARSCSG